MVETESFKKSAKSNFENIFVHFIRNSSENIINFNVKPDDLIKALKSQIQDKIQVPIDQQRLFYEKQKLEDCLKLSYYRISNESTLYLIPICTDFPLANPSSLNLLLEDFHNKKQISSGSFGTVHQAQNKATEEKIYAIKTMTFQSGKNQEEIQREIDIWENLQLKPRPNAIPNFYGFKKEDLGFSGISYHLIFDYFPKSLQSLLDDFRKNKRTNPLPFQKLNFYSKSLINALAYLQSMNVCHRDLKPANLLLDESEKQIYLIDLGESKEIIAFAPAQTKADLTVAGSPKYFSPELDLAFKNNDPKVNINPFKSDVFSFGLVFLELGTLEIPKKDLDLKIWEQNIKKSLKDFRKIYENLLIEENEKERFNEFAMTLEECLHIKPQNRPDFHQLFKKSLKNISDRCLKEHILAQEKEIDSFGISFFFLNVIFHFFVRRN